MVTLGMMSHIVTRGRWQQRMKTVNLATHFSKTSFYQQWKLQFLVGLVHTNKNLAIANRSRVSCAHNTSTASIGLIITP